MIELFYKLRNVHDKYQHLLALLRYTHNAVSATWMNHIHLQDHLYYKWRCPLVGKKSLYWYITTCFDSVGVFFRCE